VKIHDVIVGGRFAEKRVTSWSERRPETRSAKNEETVDERTHRP
jgi:hypothetical protein